MKKLDKEKLEAIVDLFPHCSVTDQLTEIGLIEPKFELNKWYKFKIHDLIFFVEGVDSSNDVVGYGFNQGVFEDKNDGAWCDISDCETVTELEVFNAFREAARKYHYNEIWMNENVLYTNNGVIFNDGKWLPKKVTIKGINYIEINK